MSFSSPSINLSMLTNTKLTLGIVKSLSFMLSTTPLVNAFDLLFTSKMLTSGKGNWDEILNFDLNHLRGCKCRWWPQFWLEFPRSGGGGREGNRQLAPEKLYVVMESKIVTVQYCRQIFSFLIAQTKFPDWNINMQYSGQNKYGEVFHCDIW